jgi:putative ABC transport system permease protein
MLLKNWGVTAVIIVVLGLGIGVNTAIFSVVNAALLRPLPYDDPERLVWLSEDSPQVPELSISYPDFLDWREQNTVFSGIAATQFRSLNLTGLDEPERLSGRAVSANFHDVLGVKPALGRSFVADEDRPGANRVCVISHGLWQRRFGSDIGILGRQLSLSGEGYTVVGVLPETYRFGTPTDVFVPIGLRADEMKERGSHPGIYAIARLKPGVTIEAARAEIVRIAEGLATQYGMPGQSALLTPLHEFLVSDVRTSLLVLLVAVGFVLAIACANVANLLLARAASRRKEVAIRTALGAGRWRIIRQLLTESVLLSLIGGTVGLLLAVWGIDVLRAASADILPTTALVNLDSKVLLFTLFISLFTGVIFGLAPALGASKADMNETLKEGGRGATGGRRGGVVRSLLVVSEVALSLVLLVGAGLLIKSFLNILNTDPGFDARNLLTMQLSLKVEKNDGRKVLNFFAEAQDRIAALPGVEAAAYSNGLPLTGASDTAFAIEGRPKPEPGQVPQSMLYVTSPSYLKAMGIRLVRGRFFTTQDTQSSPRVAVIDEVFARQQFPDQDPIGQHLAGNENNPTTEIVGVVAHVKHFGLDSEERIKSQLYLPFNQAPDEILPMLAPRMNLVLRTTADPLALTAAVRREVQALDPNQPVYNVTTMEQTLDRSLATQRLSTMLLMMFACVALVLAAVGIYGVMSYVVTQRRHEIGIRIALGAQRVDVLRLVLRQGMWLTACGVLVGLVAAFALSRLMASLLFGVSPTDPLTFGLVALGLAVVTLIACLVPARRALKVDPMIALRYE